jgi:hypothetical protein
MDILHEYFKSQPIEKAWLFGSMARGEATTNSDVDIIVRFEKESHVGLFKHVAITDDLERILKRAVDLVTDGSLMPWVEETANKDKILIYERKTTYQNFLFK